MNKIRKKLNDILKEEGNKLVPHVMTGRLITKDNYGLGDMLTYNIGYRHTGALIGASIPFLGSMQGLEYNIPNVSANIIIGIPFEIIFGGVGYLTGFIGDIAIRRKNERKRNKQT